MSVPMALVEKFAPVVRLHPNEGYFPMDPLDFIRASRFRHHKSWVADQGYNKASGAWETSNSHDASYYDVPVAFINGYGAWTNGENRRPRDPNNGDKWNVFLEPDEHPRGRNDPNGTVPVFYYATTVDTSSIPAPTRELFGIAVESYIKIQYWWFHGYNDGPGPGGTDNHQGDWEHVTCKVRDEQLVGVHFAQHDTIRHVTANDLVWKDGRYVVYSARGSHGSYEAPGRYPLILGFEDETKDGGREWNTRAELLRLADQPWRDYAGAWGQVGEFSHTTGPLGPWHKRFKT